jgi:hypothetical protein
MIDGLGMRRRTVKRRLTEFAIVSELMFSFTPDHPSSIVIFFAIIQKVLFFPRRNPDGATELSTLNR